MLGVSAMPGAQEADVPEVEVRVVADDLSEAPTAADVNLETTSSTVTVIDPARHAGEDVTLPALLEREVGLQVRRAGTDEAFATVSLRGTASNQVLVCVDGIPLNTGRTGVANLGEIPMAAIERIEVFRGSSPAQFPDAAIGGIINIRTRRNANLATISGMAGLESFGILRGQFQGCNGFALGDLFYSLTLARGQGNYPFLNNNGTEFNDDDDTWDTRVNNDFTQTGADLKCRFFAGGDTTVTLAGIMNFREQGIPGVANNQSRSARYASDTALFTVAVDAPASEGGGYVLRLFARQGTDDFKDLDAEVGLGRQHVRSVVTELGLQGVGDLRRGPWSATLSAEFSAEDFAPEDILGDSSHTYVPYPSGRDKSALALGLAYDAVRWTGSLTLRHMALANDLNADVAVNHATDSTFTWQAGLKCHVNDTWSARFNYGIYTRFPTMGELFGDWGYFLGTPDLVPETGLSVEAAAAYVPPGGGVLGLTRMELAVFRIDIWDYIQYLFNAQGVGRPENLGRALITGLELEAHHAWDPAWRFDHGFTLQTPVDHTAVSYNYGNFLPGRSRLSYTADLSWQAGRFRVFSSLLAELDTYYDGPNLRPAPDKYPVGAGVEVALGGTRKGVARVDNLFDARYEDYGGYPLPGRTYALSYMMSW
ncbi:MAG: TonB-dependent receptor [Planctomycetota bacterium]